MPKSNTTVLAYLLTDTATVCTGKGMDTFYNFLSVHRKACDRDQETKWLNFVSYQIQIDCYEADLTADLYV